ncbi:MAG: hypothetical protein QOD84_2701 [Acidobacteriaceae bacterium]|jgi:hypothetical protein
MPTIRVLTPKVTREQALAEFSSGGLTEYWRGAAYGPLRSVADFYIPFRLFQVEISNGGKLDQRILGIDAVGGSLSPYSFATAPCADDVISVDTRNCLQVSTDESSAKATVISKVQRILFATGFFRIGNLEVSAREIPGEIHIPYWVGVRDSGRKVTFTVMDAVRRQLEGGKVKLVLHRWISSR